MAVAGRIDKTHDSARVTSEILDRMPPQNLDAERAVLGSILLDPNMCDEVALLLRPQDFYADPNAKLYEHMLQMHDAGKRIDPMLLVEALKQSGSFEVVGGAAYLAEVAHSVPVAAHAVHYANIVRDKALLRGLIHTTTLLLRDAYDPTLEPRQLLNQAEERIFAVNEGREADCVTSMNELLVEAFKQIDYRLEHGGATGTPTGFTDLDNMCGGLHPAELVILAARPSMGKTALATNIVEHAAIHAGVPTLFVSLEMSRLELVQRMLCSRGKIDGRKFRSGFVSSQDREKLVEASAELSRAPIFVDDSPARTVTEIAAAARRLKRKSGLGLIVIDYLQLIEPENSRDPRQEQVAKIARHLKHLARKLEVPVFCLAQLNRQADDERPKMSHLRESGAIEQDADMVMFVHREDYGMSREEATEKEVLGKATLIVSKQRNGPVGDVNLLWFPEFTRFESVSHRSHSEFEGFSGGGNGGGF